MAQLGYKYWQKYNEARLPHKQAPPGFPQLELEAWEGSGLSLEASRACGAGKR